MKRIVGDGIEKNVSLNVKKSREKLSKHIRDGVFGIDTILTLPQRFSAGGFTIVSQAKWERENPIIVKDYDDNLFKNYTIPQLKNYIIYEKEWLKNIINTNDTTNPYHLSGHQSRQMLYNITKRSEYIRQIIKMKRELGKEESKGDKRKIKQVENGEINPNIDGISTNYINGLQLFSRNISTAIKERDYDAQIIVDIIDIIDKQRNYEPIIRDPDDIVTGIKIGGVSVF